MNALSRSNPSSIRHPLHSRGAVAVLAASCVLAIIAISPVHAQTLTVLHAFTGESDGANPDTGLSMDAAGNLYGTTYLGGANGFGNIFKLKRAGENWLMTPLYNFTGQNDGAEPITTLTIAPDGTLYSASGGGQGIGACCGAVFHLQPSPNTPRSALTPWDITLLHHFIGTDGKLPSGSLYFDQSGNIFAATLEGGTNNNGVIYELSPSGGGYTQTILFNAPSSGNQTDPWGDLTPDGSGNLFGVFEGAEPPGAVFELSPSGSGWTLNVIYPFTGGSDGNGPMGGLIRDQQGNLYGTTWMGGDGGGGTVFELSPSNGGWTFTLLYSFPAPAGPTHKLLFDAAGNLYGTTQSGGTWGNGMIYKLTRPGNGGPWSYSTLYNFTGGNDGGLPFCGLIFDADGNLYGTTNGGGAHGFGVAFELTP